MGGNVVVVGDGKSNSESTFELDLQVWCFADHLLRVTLGKIFISLPPLPPTHPAPGKSHPGVV